MAPHFGYISNSFLYRSGNRFFYNTGEWNYLTCMAERASHIDVFSRIKNREPGKGARFLPEGVIQVHEIPRRSYLRTYFSFKHFVQNWDFCFLMVPSWYSYGSYLWCRRNNVPFAVCFRGDWKNKARLESRFKPAMVPLTSRAEKNLIRDAHIRMGEGGLLKDRYADIADSIIPCLTCEIRQDVFQTRSEPFFKAGSISLFFVGALIPRKGVDVLLDAVALVGASRSVNLVIAGQGPSEKKLRDQTIKLGIQNDVVFAGQIPFDQLLDEYRKSDIFVLPAYSEGFARVILESFSQSLPVITTPVGAHKISMIDEQHCLFTAPGDREDLATKILQLADDSNLTSKLSQNGYDFAKHLFANHPVKEFEESLRRVLKRANGERQ